MRPVSLESVGPEGGHRGKFSKKVNSGGITEKGYATNAFSMGKFCFE
jgi:hypothetical protein